MQKTVVFSILAVSAYAAASGTLAAPAQDRFGTDRPGAPTKPIVWVENRSADEAIPVTVVPPPDERPQRVEIVVPSSTVLQTRQVPQRWEYRSITIAAGEDPAQALLGPGQDGWEATGVQIPARNGSTLLLKRILR